MRLDPKMSQNLTERNDLSAGVALFLDGAAGAAKELPLEMSFAESVVAGAYAPIKRWYALLVILADAAALIASFALGALLRQPLGSRDGPITLGQSLLREVPFVPIYLVALVGYGLYRRQRRRLSPTSFLELGSLAHALVAGSFFTLAVSAFLHRFAGAPKVGWSEALFMILPAMVLVPAAHTLSRLALRSRGIVRSRLVVVGSGAVASSLVLRLQRCPDIEVVGFVDDRPHVRPPCPYLGTISDLSSVCTNVGADRVLVAFSSTPPALLMDSLRRLPGNVAINVVPRLFELVTWQSQVEELHGLTVMDVAPPSLGPISQACKRGTDVVMSAALLMLLSPVMAAIAIAVKLTSPGPIFFRQSRAGYRGEVFRIFKFRTMAVGADDLKIDLREHNEVDGPLFKIRVDPRVTKIGRYLRSTSLDEVPQLINVLLGQMSLVGPRPFVPNESAEINGWAARRFDVRPGMTGLWQISGRNDLPFEELRQLDYAYVASWSLWWDLKILWLTPGSVLRRHGAY
jgi:exopolysaccharide biosynthesis polyprenyl glycosylphosphotransferase